MSDLENKDPYDPSPLTMAEAIRVAAAMQPPHGDFRRMLMAAAAELERRKHLADLWQWAAKLAATPAPEGKSRHCPMYYFDDATHRLTVASLGAVDSFEIKEGNHGRDCVFLLVYPGDPRKPEATP